MADRILLLGTLQGEDVKSLLDARPLPERLQMLAAMNEAMREEYLGLKGIPGAET